MDDSENGHGEGESGLLEWRKWKKRGEVFVQQLTKAEKRERFWKQLKKQKSLHLILGLAIVYLIIFN